MNTRRRGNGQGTAFKRGGKWTAQITIEIEKDEDGKIINRKFKSKGGFATKREALAYIPTMFNEPLEKRRATTFAELYDLWFEPHCQNITKHTVKGYTSAYAKCEALYKKEFASLKTADLQEVIDACTLSRRTKENIKCLFSNLYNYAMQNDYATKNYSQYVKLPKKSKSTKDAFTDAEIQKLWEDYNNGNSFTAYILIMIYTGMRYGEMCTVLKENINCDEKYIVGGIKSNAGIDRVIPINEKILPVIAKVYPTIDKRLLEISDKVYYTKFYGTLERLGMRKLNPHCCRHTFFTLTAKAGIQPAIITAIGGHGNYSTTMQYTHIKLNEMLDAVNKI